MSEPIALFCPYCQRTSYRPVGFVRAKSHFVCNYCHDIVKIDRHKLLPVLTEHRREIERDVLAPLRVGRHESGRLR
jgi:transposase-like protein